MLIIFWLLFLFKTTQSVQIVKSFGHPFKFIWNVPTFQCRSHKIFFEELLAQYDVINNKNDAFKGEKMTILYDPGSFPAIFDVEGEENERFLRNGGVPQNGNISEHLKLFENRIWEDIPQENYSGLAVIDFESWRPIFRQNWGTLQPYKELSIKIEQKLHPNWNKSEVLREATSRFEEDGRTFVERTLDTAKLLRPLATWGYYAYPYCFNMQMPDKNPICSKQVLQENDRLMWMFEGSNSLHPSLYLTEKEFTPVQRQDLIKGRIHEALRIRSKTKDYKKIYPYFWYAYRDSFNYLSLRDLSDSFSLLKSFSLDGVIIWGSSNDVNTKTKCAKLYNYVETIFGPLILSLQLS